MKTLYEQRYESPLGEMLLTATADGLRNLWFADEERAGEIHAETGPYPEPVRRIFDRSRAWLDDYFAGREPGREDLPPLAPSGTDFQLVIWSLLWEIPYGTTVSYGEIADRAEVRRNGRRPSAQAVGQAIGHNPIAIMIPCHRVIGADGSLVGYAGGLPRKEALLAVEGALLI